MYTDLLFDLDGTLTESGPGIMKSVRYAMRQLGKPLEDDRDLRFCVGPPLRWSFERLGVEPENIQRAIDEYRVYFRSEGMFDNKPYPGVKEMLEALHAAGKHLHIATSKPDVLAIEILRHFDLLDYFEVIAAATMNEQRSTKTDVIAYALSCLKEVPVRNVLMIGDREHDVKGAAAFGIDCLGVLYGYGSREELESAGAKYIAATPYDIIQFT